MSMLSPDVSVLNCGAGDMTFSFDPNDPLECARAERVIKDMLKRGYLLFAKIGESYTRVLEFDDKRHEYIIADGPDPSVVQEARYTEPPEPKIKEPKTKPGKKTKRIPARGAKVTGIAPTAGG